MKDTTDVDTAPVPLGHIPTADTFGKELFMAANRPHVKSKKISKLLERNQGSSIDHKNSRGQTALYCICLQGRESSVDVLLRHGANPNERSHDGSTAVHASCWQGSIHILQQLISMGGDLRLHDKQQRTPRDWALLQHDPQKRRKMIEFIHTCRMYAMTNSGRDLLLERQPTSYHNLGTSLVNLVTGSSGLELKTSYSMGFGKMYLGGDKPGVMASIPHVLRSTLRHIDRCTYFNGPFTQMQGMMWKKTMVTVKQLRDDTPSGGVVDLLITESEYMGQLRHTNILLLMAVCPTDNLDGIKLVYEPIGLGSMFHVLHERMEAPTVRNTAEVMLQVCEALIYIHEQQLVHCAVSSNSIHLVTPYAAKLANFEYMVPRGNTSGAHTNMHECAVYNWLAPELMNAEPATEMADVYSFCSVLWEMLNGMMPWPERSASEIKQVITKQGKTLPLSNNKVPQLLHDVLERGLQLASYDRSVSFDDLRELLLVSLRSSNSRKSSKFSLKPLNDTLGGSYERKTSHSKLVSPLTNTSYSGRFQEMNENQLQEASLQKPPSPARNMSTRRIAIRKLMTGRTGLTSGEDSDDDKSMDDVNTQGPTYSGGKQYGTPATLDSSMKSTHDSSFSEDAPSDTVYNTKWGPKAEYRHEESGAACYPAGHSRERPLVDPKLIGIVSSHRGYKSISPVKYGTAPQNGSAPGDSPKSVGSNRERWNRSNSLQDDPVMHRPPAGHAKQGSYGSRRSSAGYGQNTSFASYSSRGSVGSLAIPNYCVGMKPAGHGCEVSVGSKQSTHHTSYSRLPDDIRDAVMYKAPHIDASYSELPENPTREAIKEKWFGGKGSVRNLISAYHDIEKEEIEASQKSYTYLRSHLSQSSMNSQRLDSDLPDTQLKTLYSAAGVDSNRPAYLAQAPEVSTQQMASRSDGSGSTDLDCSAVSVEAHQGSPAIQQQPSDTSSSGTDNAKPSSESAEDPQSFLDYAKAMRDQVTAEIRDSFSNLKLKPVGERTNGSQPTSSSDSSRGKQLEVTFSEYVMEREHSDNLPTSADSSVNTEGFPASVEREDYGDEIMSNGMSGAEARIRPTCPDGYPEFQQQNGIDADLNNLISPRNLPTHDIYLDDEYGEKTLDLSMELPPAYDDMDENDMDENDLEDIINAGSCLEKADEERMETTANKVFEIERGNEYTVRIEASGDDDKQHVTHTMKNLKTGESKTVLAHTVNAPGSFEQCVVINSGAS